MSSLNKVILIGRVGKDPEVRISKSGIPIAAFPLATSDEPPDETGQRPTQWHNIVLFGKNAEVADKYVKKGMLLLIEGRIKYRKYEDSTGQTRYITEIIGNNMKMLSRKDERPSVEEIKSNNIEPTPIEEPINEEIVKEELSSFEINPEEAITDDDLPF